jgi:hypothetical protein
LYKYLANINLESVEEEMKLPKGFIESSYDFACKTDNAWFLKGNELYHSSLILRNIYLDAFPRICELESLEEVPNSQSDLIIRDLGVLNQSTMLMGFAIENFLKGIIVKEEQVELDDKIKKLPEFLKSHDLKSLAVRAEILFNKKENMLLSKFTESIIFSGRYPVPVRVEEFQKFYNKNAEPTFLIKNNNKEELPTQVASLLNKINLKMKKE